jgi:hypothetical protein
VRDVAGEVCRILCEMRAAGRRKLAKVVVKKTRRKQNQVLWQKNDPGLELR